MMDHRTNMPEGRHPTDTALAAWVDERAGGPELAGHLAACAACRGRVEALQHVVETLRADPDPLDPGAAAASRARILAAIGSRARVHPVPSPRRSFRPALWIPTAAAAGLALLLVLRSGETERAPVTETAVAEPALPTVALAGEAAAEIAEGLEIVSEDAGDVATADLEAMETALLDAVEEPLPGAGVADFTVVEEFEGLETDDQEAVLMELAASDFEL